MPTPPAASHHDADAPAGTLPKLAWHSMPVVQRYKWPSAQAPASTATIKIDTSWFRDSNKRRARRFAYLATRCPSRWPSTLSARAIMRPTFDVDRCGAARPSTGRSHAAVVRQATTKACNARRSSRSVQAARRVSQSVVESPPAISARGTRRRPSSTSPCAHGWAAVVLTPPTPVRAKRAPCTADTPPELDWTRYLGPAAHRDAASMYDPCGMAGASPSNNSRRREDRRGYTQHDAGRQGFEGSACRGSPVTRRALKRGGTARFCHGREPRPHRRVRRYVSGHAGRALTEESSTLCACGDYADTARLGT